MLLNIKKEMGAIPKGRVGITSRGADGPADCVIETLPAKA